MSIPGQPSLTTRFPWPLRSIMSGTAGTAVLTAAYAIERRIRESSRSLDYDDSLVPGQIVASILHLGHVTGLEEDELGLTLRWSYGSAFGVWHGLLRRKLPEPIATALFQATLMTATLTMFPLLGRTPPPWRWPKGYLATSFATHTAYAVAVGATDDRLRSDANA
jgi:hypothetical protein